MKTGTTNGTDTTANYYARIQSSKMGVPNVCSIIFRSYGSQFCSLCQVSFEKLYLSVTKMFVVLLLLWQQKEERGCNSLSTTAYKNPPWQNTTLL